MSAPTNPNIRKPQPLNLKLQPLNLTRETVADLTEDQAEKAAGGVLSGTYCASTVTQRPTSTALTCSCA